MAAQQVVLRETTAKAKATESKGIWRVKVIEGDVHGSSGYYPASVLERDGGRAFPSGTHVYLDHPTWEEEWERPERSVRDLVGALTEDAHYEDDPEEGKGLYAKVEFREAVREDVEFYAKHAGMSIRAIGISEESPTTGEMIVTELVEGLSVDIVTHAGAGGKLVTMAESARKGSEAPQLFELKESDKNGMEKLFAAVTALETTVSGLLTKVQEAETRAQEGGTDEGLSAAQLIEKLDATDLPAVSRKRLAEAYKPGDDFDAAVAAEVELIKQVREAAAPVQGQGQTHGNVQESGGQKADELAALKKLGWAS